MSQNNYNGLYGNAEETTSNSSTGEVQGYAISHYDLNDKGSLEVHFTKKFESGKSLTQRIWVNEVDPEKVKVWDGKTKEECVNAEIRKVNMLIKNLVTNYVDDKAYAAAMSQVKDFPTLVQATKGLLPDNIAEVEGRLVVGYQENGYLGCPRRLVWDAEASRRRPFFSVNPDTVLIDLSKTNLLAEEPTPESEVEDSDTDNDF